MRRLLPLFLLAAASAFAHVGSPDVFYESNAGPYKLLVTIRTPTVIPGVAQIEVRDASNEVERMRIVPTPLTGPGAKFAPIPDVAQRSKDDPHFFTGSLWMMTAGSWQVRVTAEGAKGTGQLSVPVPALASSTKRMQGPIGIVLAFLGVFLLVGAVSIVGAGVRESQLEPGVVPDAAHVRRSWYVMIATAALLVVAIYFANSWWNSEATRYDRYIFKPLQMSATLESGDRLTLRLSDPGWLRMRKVDDLIPDHNHLMHLYVISLPNMDRVWHLHPELVESSPAPAPKFAANARPETRAFLSAEESNGEAVLSQNLPPMPAGRYALYGDIVHSDGLPETLVTELNLPAVAGHPLQGDDAGGSGPPISAADFNRTVAQLPDGWRMVWDRDPGPLHARRATSFRFRLEDAQGKPAQDMELYMGMPGHAAFVRDDRSVFAHIHPSGSVPMASLGLTQNSGGDASMAGMSHGMMGHNMMGHSMTEALPAEVSFLYGFPKPGDYRIYVQVKHGGTVETGVFDARVEN
jgi:hypothetical protein